eukprot:1145960-Pelagomonas_calceolata.AAC.2
MELAAARGAQGLAWLAGMEVVAMHGTQGLAWVLNVGFVLLHGEHDGQNRWLKSSGFVTVRQEPQCNMCELFSTFNLSSRCLEQKARGQANEDRGSAST